MILRSGLLQQHTATAQVSKKFSNIGLCGGGIDFVRIEKCLNQTFLGLLGLEQLKKKFAAAVEGQQPRKLPGGGSGGDRNGSPATSRTINPATMRIFFLQTAGGGVKCRRLHIFKLHYKYKWEKKQ